MNAQDIIQALERWGFDPQVTPKRNIEAIMMEWNQDHELEYTTDDILNDSPLILAWLRDPTIIDPDHDDAETWIRRHHG